MNREEVRQLMKDARYRGTSLDGKLVETHISWVILTGRYVFKIKKPMHYSFLDFSTLARRKNFCGREVELNRRLTSGVYLGIEPVRRHDGALQVGNGEGRIIDHLVVMKRLRTALEMDRVIRRGALKRIHMDRLAERIAAFHEGAEITGHEFRIAEAREEFNDISSVSEWMEGYLGKAAADTAASAVERSNAWLSANRPQLARRVKEGFQRDVHGDLHARNIFLYKDPVIFDCIEFNDRFRQIDVLKEVAYFCMDLDAFDCSEHSRYFIHRYNGLFPAIRNDAEWRLFYYYKAYRANVRAKVNALRGMQADGDELDKQVEEVKRYLELMTEYLDLLGVA